MLKFLMICHISFQSSSLGLAPSCANRFMPPVNTALAFGSFQVLCSRQRTNEQAMLGRRKIILPKRATTLQSPDSIVTERNLKPSPFCESLLLWTKKLRHTRPEKIAVVHHKEYSLPNWDPSHRFVMSKFDGIVKEIERDQSLNSVVRFIAPDAPASPELLGLVHTPDYVRSFCDGTLDSASMRKIGLPWSPGLVRRTTLEVSFRYIAT